MYRHVAANQGHRLIEREHAAQAMRAALTPQCRVGPLYALLPEPQGSAQTHRLSFRPHAVRFKVVKRS